MQKQLHFFNSCAQRLFNNTKASTYDEVRENSLIHDNCWSGVANMLIIDGSNLFTRCCL